MTYDQVMGCLGKKTINQLQKLRKAQQLNANNNHSQDNESMDEAIQSHRKKPSGVNFNYKDSGDKLEINKQSSEMVILKQLMFQVIKGNDINNAMKYRAAKTNPKAVEVWSSKIHRNGLFACQE